jgi:adhesin transport system outer membrane protein
MSMKDAVVQALRTNPEINEAIANRQAIEFELEQGRGLYRPRVDVEGSIGGEIRDDSTTRDNDDEDHLFLRRQASVVVRQTLFDGFGIDAEVERQASRVDGASLRVRERSEFIALAVIREYLEIARLQRVIAINRQNIGYHNKILGEISRGASEGSLSIADRQQAQERVFAAKAALIEFDEELRAAQVVFIRLVGKDIGEVGKRIDIKGKGSKSLEEALKNARVHHPSIKFAKADIDAAAAQVKAAESKFMPKVSLEGRGSLGEDLGGVRGTDNDLQGNLVVNWNIYNGGIDAANKQEQIRHVDEAYHHLHKITREVEEGVRLSWNRRTQQSRRLKELLRELSATDQLQVSYTEQFKIGERSLLDLLDNQNTRFSLQIAVATGDSAVKFADYRILASQGHLLQAIGVAAPAASKTYARKDAEVPATPSPDDFDRVDQPKPKSN